ncbi:MAG: GTPase [Bacteroidota bacterium]
MNKPIAKLVFVYNANSGKKNALLDSLHKVISPSTYDCNLCDITFGVVRENRKWKRFRKESQYPMEFLHRDEFQKTHASKFGYKFEFPIVLAEGEKGLEVFISTQELNGLKTPEALIQLIEERTA